MRLTTAVSVNSSTPGHSFPHVLDDDGGTGGGGGGGRYKAMGPFKKFLMMMPVEYITEK